MITEDNEPALDALTEEYNRAALEKLAGSIESAIQNADIGDVLALVTGVMVSLTVELVKRQGHDVTKAIRVDGGKNRDITIHPPKA